MTFPNALEGVKKIYKAQILTLIGTALMLLVAVFGAIMLISGDTTTITVLGILALVVSLVALVLLIIGFIQYIMGINRAKKDESSFNNALICVIVSLVLSIVIAFLSSKPTLKSILQIVQTVVNFGATYFIITGIRSLAKQLDRDDIDNHGKTTLYILIGVYALTIIASLLSAIFSGNAAIQAAAGIISIVAEVLSLVQLIIYLVFLKRSSEMLEA